MDKLFEKVITKQDWILVWVVAAALVVVVALSVFFVYLPQADEMGLLDEQIAETESDLAELRQVAQRMDMVEEQLADIERLVAQFEAKLPTRKEIPKLYRKFQLAAGDANVVVRLIEKLDEEKNMSRVDIPYVFEVTGSYHDLATFLNALEMGQRFVNISDIHIEEEKLGVSDAEFKLTTYLFVEEGAEK